MMRRASEAELRHGMLCCSQVLDIILNKSFIESASTNSSQVQEYWHSLVNNLKSVQKRLKRKRNFLCLTCWKHFWNKIRLSLALNSQWSSKESLASGRQMNKQTHITRREGSAHLVIISTRNPGPDAKRFTVFKRPEPSVASSDVFISKNLTKTNKNLLIIEFN